MKRILISLLMLSAFAVSTAWPQTSGFKLAAPVGMPGDNPAYEVNPVLLFNFVAKGPLAFQAEIPANPETHLNDPICAAFNNQGELFIANRHGNVGNGAGSIARFVPDRNGNYLANGAITGNGLEAVHGLAFSPKGELFASNIWAGRVSRFLFDPRGNAIPNGIIEGVGGIGLAFNNKGELFVASGAHIVWRYLLNHVTGEAIPHGEIQVANPGEAYVHFLAFSENGELFVSDPTAQKVWRFQFNCAGQAFASGAIDVAGPAIGVAFGPTGQLFVSLHDIGGIRRFDFDPKGNAVLVESVDTLSMGQIAISTR